MGEYMRVHDWTSSPLGTPANWPQSLRTVVRLMLNTGHPMYIWWGPELACLYNDAYRQSIGPERHPGSLGKPAREVWGEITAHHRASNRSSHVWPGGPLGTRMPSFQSHDMGEKKRSIGPIATGLSTTN